MGEITIKKALFDYKTVYMPYRNFAERTREEYLNDLRDFVKFLEERGIGNIQALGLPIIERYIARLEQHAFASRTRKRKVVAIRSFLSFLYQEHYITTNIAKMVILPFVDTTTPYVLTQRECDRLRSACAGNTRDLAIIELLLQTGIKLSELVHLTVDDIELGEKQNGSIRIRAGRGKKERIIPLNSKATAAISDYLSEKEGEQNRILFTNRFGEALGERGIQKMLRKYLKKAGIGHASIQTLRHTFGTHHIAKGTDPKTVQEVLGLKDTRSTNIYQTLAKEIVSRELEEHAL
jgi:integrase/recombinase XerD